MIGVLVELFEWMIKLMVLAIWLEIVLCVFMVFLMIWLIQACTRTPLSKFPRRLRRVPIRL